MSDDLTILAEALKDIDPAKLSHGLEQYKRFGPKTVRAILAARDLVMHTPALADAPFRIGLTANVATQEATELAAGCIAFAVIHESVNTDELRTVEADVRLNFLWHFPGRCLNKGDYRRENLQPDAANFVYIAFFPPQPILGKA